MRKPRVAVPQELDQLELKIRRLVESHESWRRRAEAAEARIRELEASVQDLSGGKIDPVALEGEVAQLQEKNRALQERLTQAHGAVLRMMSRLQFTVEDR